MIEEPIVFCMGKKEEATLDQNGLRHTKHQVDKPPKITTIALQNLVELEHEFQSCSVAVGYKDIEGDTVYIIIDFADSDEADRCLSEVSKKLGDAYTDETAQMSRISAASIPLVWGGIFLVVGSLFSGLMYFFSTYAASRTTLVKWWIEILYYMAQSVGYIPFLVLTFLLVLPCIIWAMKKAANPKTQRVVKLRI